VIEKRKKRTTRHKTGGETSEKMNNNKGRKGKDTIGKSKWINFQIKVKKLSSKVITGN
jgi:hypothetical protein